MTWFDRLTVALERMPLERLKLLRNVVDAIVTRRENPSLGGAVREAPRFGGEIRSGLIEVVKCAGG